MLPLLLTLALAQTQPAIRRSTPATDDPGMVVRQVGTLPVNCVGGCSSTVFAPDGGLIGQVSQGVGYDGGGTWGVYIEGGNLSVSSSISFDGGSIGYMRMPDGGALEVYVTGGVTSSGGWVPDGGYIGLVGLADGGGVFVTNFPTAFTVDIRDAGALSVSGAVTTTQGPGQDGGAWNVSVNNFPTSVTVDVRDGGVVGVTQSGPFTVAATQSGTWTVRNQDGTGNALASSTTAPAGTEQALIVRNIPSGTQTVSGSVTASGTVTANQGTPNSTANRWPTQLTDGTDLAQVSAGGALLVDGSATTQPVSGTVSLSGTSAVNVSQVGGNAVTTGSGAAGTGTQRVILATDQPVIPISDNGGSITVDGTVAATQSGTWNITNVSGTVSLPTGASTSALQTTGNTSLGNLDTKTPALGQTTMAGSSPVVIASNQSAVPVSGTFWQATQPVSAVSLPLPSGAATETTLSSRLSDSTFTGRFPASASLADATANPSLTASAGYLMAYNGTTWDRLRKSSSGLLVDIQNSTLAVTQSGTWNVGLNAGTNYVGKTRITDGTLDVTLLNSAPGTDTGQVSVPVRIISSLAGGAGGTSSSFTSAFPASGTAAGYNDGTNMQGARVYDTDTGAGDQFTLGASLRVSASGGSAEAAAGAGTTSASTLRVVLPTDQTSIPVTDNGGSLTVDGTVAVSGTVDTELPTAASLADATANPSTTSVGSLLLGYNGTTWDRLRATTANGLLVDVSRIAAGTNYIGKTRLTDGTLDVSLLNSAPGSDTGQVAMPVRIISSLAGGAGGTSSSYGAAFPASGTAAGFSDGTNMQSGRVFDADTGGGSQYVLGANLRVSASGGSTEAAAGAGATSASTLRVVLPTDQTAIPITDNAGSITVDGTVAVSSVGGTVTVSGTVDTELPTAAALADATSNPTTTSVGALGLLYNGTTWDRMRGDTTNGLLVNVSDSFLLDATFTGRFSAAAAASDNFSNPTTTGTLGFNMLWDGVTWDRAPGNSTDGTLVNLGANNDVTVTGTVTANAGTGNFTVVQSTASSLRAQTASESATSAAIPATASAAGFSDGTNLQIPRVTDVDTSGGGTIWAPLAAVAGGGFGAPVLANVEEVAPGSGATGLYVWPISKDVANPVTTAVTCATTATAAPASVLTYRTTLTVTNNSDVTIYLGGSAVTTSTGIPLLPGASFQDDVAHATYYCIVASGTANLRVLEN